MIKPLASLTFLAFVTVFSTDVVLNAQPIGANILSSRAGKINSNSLAQNYQQQANLLAISGIQKFKQKDYSGAIADFSKSIEIAKTLACC